MGWVCPRDIYSHTVRNKDRWIVASFNDHKETRSTTVRLGPAVPVPGLILNTILGIIRELGDPYVAKPGLGGMTAYPPMAMAAVCIMLEAERTTYRKMVGMLRNNHAMATKMGLTKIPSKSTIARSYGLIPEWYLVHVHQTVIREVEAGSLAGDSTGFSYLRFVRWFDVRAYKFRDQKGLGQDARHRGYPHQGDNPTTW